jgi:hypothetical protein
MVLKMQNTPRLRFQEIESNGKEFIRIILDDSHIDLAPAKVEKLYRFLMLFVKKNQNVRDADV